MSEWRASPPGGRDRQLGGLAFAPGNPWRQSESANPSPRFGGASYRTHFALGLLLSFELIGGAGGLVDCGGAVEGFVLRVLADERELHVRGEQSERFGNVTDTEHVQEVWPLAVRQRRVNND